MAEKSTSPHGTPEIIINMQRGNSGGKVASSNGGEKELPRYLRASTGSCHDFCKYGRKHVPEEKPWRPRLKKIVKKLPDEKNEALSSGPSEERKKTLMVKKKQVDSEKCSHDDPEIIKREVVKIKLPAVVSDMLKQEGQIKLSGGENPVEQRDSAQKKKKKTESSKPKSSTVPESKTLGNTHTQKQKVLSKSPSGRPTLKSKESKPTCEHVASPMLKPRRGFSGGKDSDIRIDKKVGVSKVVAKKVPVTPRASFSPKASMRRAGTSSLRKSQSLKVASSPPNQKPSDEQYNDEPNPSDGYLVQEKTLHVIKMEVENNKVSEYDQNEQCIEPSPPPSSSSTQKDEDQEEYDEYTDSEAEEYEYPSGSNEPESAEEEDAMSNKEKKPRQRNEGHSPNTARRLRFRRGKMVDVQTEGGNPRKLKFRRGRVLGEHQSRNGDRRRSFKKREDNGDAEDDDNPTDGKVVLRHQDVQDKKDAQGLFNNVIEETASKLAETRKSKVKALVGAFETVISLQESKPSANTAA